MLNSEEIEQLRILSLKMGGMIDGLHMVKGDKPLMTHEQIIEQVQSFKDQLDAIYTTVKNETKGMFRLGQKVKVMLILDVDRKYLDQDLYSAVIGQVGIIHTFHRKSRRGIVVRFNDGTQLAFIGNELDIVDE